MDIIVIEYEYLTGPLKTYQSIYAINDKVFSVNIWMSSRNKNQIIVCKYRYPFGSITYKPNLTFVYVFVGGAAKNTFNNRGIRNL